ncbi:MAG TPA: lipid A export permease/ATP-binding protein MsbA [Vicinamibacterales bacterium]|nr:lipid A export permease/ATP-binding protein MsbA [Vicinamibacterales bacterium]
MTPLKRLLRYAAPYRGRFAIALMAMVLYGAGSAWLAWLVKPILDEVLIRQQSLATVAWAILAAYVLKGIGSYFSSYLMADVGQHVVLDLRNAMFRHTLGQSAAFFKGRSTGQLLSRLTNDIGQVQQVVSETLGDLLRESMAVVGFAGLLFYYDAGLALVCLTGAPLVLYPLVRLGQRLRRITTRSQEHLEHMSHVATEAYTGHRIVKAFGAEDREAARFGLAARALYRVNLTVTATVSIMPPVMEFLGGAAMASALWYGSREIARGRMTEGEFTAFLAALFLMYGPLKKLSRVNANIQQGIAAAQRVFELLDTHTEVTDLPGAPALPPLARSIEFRDVSFEYEDARGKSALRHVSFTVAAGQTVAIVGRSGAGKTSLVNLLPRFYDTTGGSILIDGTDIQRVSLASLRDQIGMVTQETVLFDDTVASNIAYGRPGAPIADIEAAARAARAHEFILGLPKQYETVIGERGQRLSGGQRQRLAIARALLNDSPILILDEATSALDSESEALVQDALANLMRDRTSFVIAHRLSTIHRADVIIVLERGHVAEVGRHEELMAIPGGVYAALHAMQFGERRRSGQAPRKTGA